MKLINLLEEGRQLNPILLNLIVEILDEYFFRLLAVNALNYEIKCIPWTLRIRDLFLIVPWISPNSEEDSNWNDVVAIRIPRIVPLYLMPYWHKRVGERMSKHKSRKGK